MSSTLPSPRPRAAFETSTPTTYSTLRSNGTISPSLLHALPADQRKQISHTSVTSVPAYETSERPFLDLPQVGDDLYSNDSHADAAEQDLMSTTIADSGFNFSFDDYMTPDQSTDNQISEHTTPQEAIWERDFHPQLVTNGATQPHILDNSSQHSGQSDQIQTAYTTADAQPPKYLLSARHLSPQSNTPSPPGSARQTAAQPVPALDLSMDRFSRKRGAEALQLSTDATSLAPRPNSRHGSVSPVILVSSHSRGDSPAHAFPPRHRSLSRSHQNPIYSEPDTLSQARQPDFAEADDPVVRTGLDPNSRKSNEHEVHTINEMAGQRELSERNQEVEDWLSRSNSGTDVGEEHAMRQLRVRADRPRALSAGVRVDGMGLPLFSDVNIPGPGVLLDQDSDDDYSDDSSFEALVSEPGTERAESPPVESGDLDEGHSYFPAYNDEEIPPEMQEPLPRQFYRRGPWQDPLSGPIHKEKWQPFSSNAAMMRYNEESAKWESASRAATWGTRRRLSDGEVQSIVDGSRVRHLSLVKRGRNRGFTLIKRAKSKASDLIPRRSNSNIKNSVGTPSSPEPMQMVESPQPRESFGSINPLQRISSFGKSKLPPVDMTAINTTLSNSGQAEATSADSQRLKSDGGLRSPLSMLRKARSKSDVGKNSVKSSPGLHELMTNIGGPPVPSMASPMPQRVHEPAVQDVLQDAVLDDDDDDLEEDGIRMDLSMKVEHIIPNLEGFKYHAKHLNPRLEPYLIDRIGHEQVRRYKKLLDVRVKHKRTVANRNCPSREFCPNLGGEARLLTPRPSNKDPDAQCAQFSVQDPGHEDEDEHDELQDGVVTPALFPMGIPLPPVRRLPAEFECFLCFKVKKFQKPSDWTKHVHEDVQPFSCTFPNCTEPKSFKRKADWVRHENERHRRLEYWKCSVQDCNHVCYRKDNFVQHLVREHKKSEPKVKKKANGKNKDGQEESEVWRLVDTCRHETATKPKDEPCKFCGNICSSWKKLSVHMGKHMEQIAMPVLELVNRREVGPDTIISPIEQLQQNAANNKMSGNLANPGPHFSQGIPISQFGTVQQMTTSPALATQHDPSLSPYSHSAHSHHLSSAGHSPAVMQASPHLSTMDYNESAYYANVGMNEVHGPMNQSEAYGNAPSYEQTGFASNGLSGQYTHLDTQINHTYSPGHAMSTPHSAQSMPMTMGPTSANGYGHHGNSPYANTPDIASFQTYPPTSQPGTFTNTTNDQQQHYNVHDQYGQHQNMYPHY